VEGDLPNMARKISPHMTRISPSHGQKISPTWPENVPHIFWSCGGDLLVMRWTFSGHEGEILWP